MPLLLHFLFETTPSLGLGLASSVPGRNPMLDGFGLIAFASLFPIMAVMGYVQISQWLNKPKDDASENTYP